MEKQTLPNSTGILILGIASLLLCCCYGIGIVLGIVALVLAKKATRIYLENPEQYKGFQNVKTGKILAIIGLVLGAAYLIYIIYLLITLGGIEGIQEMQEHMLEEFTKGY